MVRAELYSVLEKKQLDAIHQAMLTVLKWTGLVVHDDKALRLLEAGGCKVHVGGKTTKFPEKVTDATVERIPNRLVLGGRDKKHDLLVEGAHIHTRPGSGYTKILDVRTKEFRNATLDDVEIAARVLEAIESRSMFQKERQIRNSRKLCNNSTFLATTDRQWSAGS